MVIKKFYAEVARFSRTNWWVYIVYLILLGIVLLSGNRYIFSVILISSLHFVADMFIMMMLNAYSNCSYREGTYFQIISMLIFTSLKIYTGFMHGGWHYLAADPIYILAAVKNYKKDVRNVDLRFVNTQTMTLLSIIIILFLLIPFKVLLHAEILDSAARWVQTIGIFLFAVSLATTTNERRRYELSLLALLGMVIGSAWETINTLESGQVVGLAISYLLLPLTVFVFYAKKWSYYMGRSETIRLFRREESVSIKR